VVVDVLKVQALVQVPVQARVRGILPDLLT
jgi:hypothetical protein